MRCPGAPKAEADYPDAAGYEAAEGTVFHEMVADCLALGLETEHFLGGGLLQDGHWVAWNDEMARSAEEGLTFVRSMAAMPDVRLFVEERVDISPWTLPDQFGTADVILVNVKERWVIIFDWKYGKEPVFAEENYQLQGYCLGAWQSIASQLFGGDASGVKVTLIIEQPRVPGAGGVWETTMHRVLEFGQHVKRQAALSTADEPPRVPGKKQCRWCRARHACGARAEWLMESIGLEMDDLDAGWLADLAPELPEDVTPERRSYLLSIAPQIRAWLEDLHKSAYRDAQKGLPVPGMKLVDGKRPKRVWKSNATHKAERALVDAIGRGKAFTEPKLLSPAEAEKVTGKPRYRDLLARYVDQGDPHPILVQASDTRPAKVSLIDAFDDL